MANLPLWKLAGSNIYWLKLAGLSGATAVILGAWGAHRAFPIDQEGKRDLKAVFETANKYHFYHTIALLAVPLCKRPAIVSNFEVVLYKIFHYSFPLQSGSLFLIGTALFSGACYYNAFTGDKSLNRLAPVGGMTLILAWLTLVL